MTDKPPGQSTANTGRLTGWKRWHHKSRIVLILLGVVAIIVYVFQAGLAKEYAGLGAALCVIAVFCFLVWHLLHVFAEEDVIEEREINKNPADKETPRESGQDLK